MTFLEHVPTSNQQLMQKSRCEVCRKWSPLFRPICPLALRYCLEAGGGWVTEGVHLRRLRTHFDIPVAGVEAVAVEFVMPEQLKEPLSRHFVDLESTFLSADVDGTKTQSVCQPMST